MLWRQLGLQLSLPGKSLKQLGLQLSLRGRSLGRIADDKQGPRELITSEIGGTFKPTIVGEWDGLDQSRKCNSIFKTQRDIISIERLSQSHGNGQEPECFKQGYELPLWVNHSMTHMLHRHEIKELRAPKVNILKHVIGAKPASRA